MVGGGHDRRGCRVDAGGCHGELGELALGQRRAGGLVGAGHGFGLVDGVVEEEGEADRRGIGAVDVGEQVIGRGQGGGQVVTVW
jgi:hypothetical protein